MKKHKIIWTPRARSDLVQIRKFIKQDSPRTAQAFTKRLREHVRRLASFPLAGAIVLEAPSRDLREIYFGNYRIIYHVASPVVEIITIHHSARLLRGGDF